MRELGRFPEAIAVFQRALALAPKSTSLFMQFGGTLVRADNLERAANVFQRVIELAPKNLQAYLNLSAIQHSRGKKRNARRTLRAGVKRNPISISTCRTEPRAKILLFRGVQNAYYTLGESRNGQPKIKLRGGNFSNRYLWDNSDYTTSTYMVLNNNLLRPNRIPKFDVVVNSIADPDIELGSLRTLARFLEQNPELRVINNPSHVMTTTRDQNYQRLNDIDGITMAKTVRVAPDQANKYELTNLLEEQRFEFPVLLRETGTHTGRTFIKSNSLEEFVTAAEELTGKEIYVIQYVENLFRKKYHRKMRFFAIAGALYPVVLHIDATWNVHGSNRKTLMAAHDWMMAEEQAFMNDPRAYLGEDVYARLEKLPNLIGLDFFGFDFNITDDGEVLIFELNPAMRHAFDHADNFEYLRPHMERVTKAFQDMIDRQAKK